MRDPARIEAVLSAIKEAWVRHPDLRLGQLLVIATKPQEPCPEVFYIEDEQLVQGITAFQAKKEGGK
jgi:hypothetical protein